MARPFVTHHRDLDMDLYLRISLELHLKRLLIGGFDRVFEIGRVFRNEGVDTRHNPEFTLLESYEAYADYQDVARMVEELVRRVALEVAGGLHLPYGEHLVNLEAPFRQTTYREALIEHAGIDFTEHLELDSLRGVARDRGVPFDERASWATLLDALMSALVEPHLVQPTFILDYPTALSPLAKRKPGDLDVVERFELFIVGHEIANAYSELNDPVEQRERMLAQAAKAEAGDEEVELADESFLVALEHGMPPAGGLGIGLERLMMLVTGERSIREVVLFPALRAQASTDES
jgi:lysyl-tRNA synthetase class 2